ncbi:class D beta-lactamase [Nocardiopsis quinghaiensis]|uniref:class D beta-lactamase n=1 Tax=Nocardiopsis quinghaiensis TaxID=464995 RepID=UPI0037446E6B
MRGDVATEEREDLEAVFSEEGVEGTFVLYDVRERTAAVVRPEEARERAVPASTFKLANTLIGLQTGAVGDVDEVLPYGGGSQPVPAWEQDVSLREALPASNVPVYQELARRVGHERMATWVDRLDYGNRSVGGADAVDRFWLEGPLEISAMEQTSFLAGLALADLPVDSGHQHALHEIATVEEGDGYTLYAKSGWARDVDPAPGWWVGWVERGEDVYTFALRVEVEEDGDAGLREPLAREMLVELEALPPEAAGE